MSKLPVLKPREVISILEAMGFVTVRQRGAHPTSTRRGRGTTVPEHRGRDVSPILLRQIAKDIGITVDDLLKLKGR